MNKCDQCQRFALNIHQLGGVLNPLSSPWLFAQWSFEIIGPFPKVAGNKRWLLVGTDYFTKWVEVESLANIRDVDAKRFVLKNIVTRFGIPHTLILDNGLQFDSKAFRMDLRRDWMMRRENRWKSCHTSFGHIGPHLVSQQGRHPFQ